MRTRTAGPRNNLPKDLVIVYEDRDILVINKPTGLLTISTEKETSQTAYFMLMDYVRKGNPKSRNRIFIVHRLDKETSGVVVFAKTEEAKVFLQEHWEDTEKTYLAIVHGTPEPRTDTISSHLAESSTMKVYSTSDEKNGKLSRTAYRVVKQAKNVSLLEVRLLTGRKHQIRVHMSDIGHPIIGDRKYGPKDEHKKLALHSWTLTFPHPFTKKPMTCTADPPERFRQMMGKIA